MRTAYIGGFLMVRLDSQPETDLGKYCCRNIHDLHQVEPKTQPGLRTQLGCVLGIRVEVGPVGRRRCPGSWCGVERTMLLSFTLFSALVGVITRTSLQAVVVEMGRREIGWWVVGGGWWLVAVVTEEEEEGGTDQGRTKFPRPGVELPYKVGQAPGVKHWAQHQVERYLTLGLAPGLAPRFTPGLAQGSEQGAGLAVHWVFAASEPSAIPTEPVFGWKKVTDQHNSFDRIPTPRGTPTPSIQNWIHQTPPEKRKMRIGVL